ncbi:hypothetical protein B0H14DRAFT_3854138 [Mycena olivaceomarginata]|nr:hypothetical protein B0H14DRAFT_3854138 [Mycena olivaceomarginata]
MVDTTKITHALYTPTLQNTPRPVRVYLYAPNPWLASCGPPRGAMYRAFLPAYAGLTQRALTRGRRSARELFKHIPLASRIQTHPSPPHFLSSSSPLLFFDPPKSADIVVRYVSSAPARLPLSTTASTSTGSVRPCRRPLQPSPSPTSRANKPPPHPRLRRSTTLTPTAALGAAHIPRAIRAHAHHVRADASRCASRGGGYEGRAVRPACGLRMCGENEEVRSDTAARGVFGTRRIT